MEKTTALKVGDEVVVNTGVIDPDFGIEIGGWAGSILEIDEIESLALIEWSAKTLESMDESHIQSCDAEDLDWTQIYLGFDEVALVQETAENSTDEQAIVSDSAIEADADTEEVGVQ